MTSLFAFLLAIKFSGNTKGVVYLTSTNNIIKPTLILPCPRLDVNWGPLRDARIFGTYKASRQKNTSDYEKKINNALLTATLLN